MSVRARLNISEHEGRIVDSGDISFLMSHLLIPFFCCEVQDLFFAG